MRETCFLAISLLICVSCTGHKDEQQQVKRGNRSRQNDSTSAVQKRPENKRTPVAKPSLQLNWDINTGRGDVVQKLSSGDLLRICFHCKYTGYSGGLVIGNQDGPGYGLYPRKPINGYKKINIFCAQDESIWDHKEKAEYTYGWSENFGKKDDGNRLVYKRGRIIKAGPESVILQSENGAGCYRVTKLAYTRLDVRWWIIATRITNSCSRPIHFDFYSGDDPWIGMYRSSDGDVGWTPEGLIRLETVRGVGRFLEGGFYDLGNKELKQKEGSFSNQANFFKLDPATVLPHHAIFANSFAHDEREIDPSRPLDNQSLTALNLGWKDIRLKPDEGFTVALALGLANTDATHSVPEVPEITDEDWTVWRKHLKEGNPSPGASAIEFAAERVDMVLSGDRMQVEGRYILRNRGRTASTIGIQYPIDSSPDRPAPAAITVDGERKRVVQSSTGQPHSRFTIPVPGQGIRHFQVAYTQPYQNRAVYKVTSALHWPGEMTRALFSIRYPETLGQARISYPITHTHACNGTIEHLLVFQPFVPNRELSITFR